MKNTHKTVSLMLVLCLLCGILSGCGGGKEDKNPDGSPKPGDTVWVPEYTELPSDIEPGSCFVTDGSFIYAFSHKWSEEDETGRTSMYKIAMDGRSCVELEGYAPYAAEGAGETESYVNLAAASPDGCIWTVEYVQCFHYELNGVPVDKISDAETVYDGGKYVARKIGSDGAEILSFDIKNEQESEVDWFSVQGIACDKDGSVVVGDSDGNIYVHDSEGRPLFTLEGSDWSESFIRTAEGAVGVSAYGQAGEELRIVDMQKKGWGEAIALDGMHDRLYDGNGDQLFLAVGTNDLAAYSAKGGEAGSVLRWLDVDMDVTALKSVFAPGDGSIVCITEGGGDDAASVVKLTRQPAESVPEKKEITLAGVYMPDSVRKEIIDFNKKSREYRITATDYSEYNTNENWDAGITKLSTEILAGKVPDIMLTEGLPVNAYAAAGLIEDFCPYLDADKELSREDIIPNILKISERDGKLYELIPTFYVVTVAGAADKVGKDMGWTVKDMTECLAKQPVGTELFGREQTRTDILNFMCAMNMDKFIDWESGKCSFESDEFTDALNFCMMFPESYPDDEPYMDGGLGGILSGKQLLTVASLSSFDDCQVYTSAFKGAVTFKGFPTEKGVGSAAIPQMGVCMSSACADKDAAWSFMRTFLTEDFQDEMLWSFPTNRHSFEKALKAAMTPRYEEDENGEQVEVSKGGMGINGFNVELYSLTEEEGETMRDVIGTLCSMGYYEEPVMEIIAEEAGAFFAGDKTVEETEAVIQSRVSIYVNEKA